MVDKAECCAHGVCEVKDKLIGNEDALNVLHGLTNKAVRAVEANPTIGVRELTEKLSGEPVTLDDTFGAEGMESIHWYNAERDGPNIADTGLAFSTLALAVATCATRAVDGTCQELYPIELTQGG